MSLFAHLSARFALGGSDQGGEALNARSEWLCCLSFLGLSPNTQNLVPLHHCTP